MRLAKWNKLSILTGNAEPSRCHPVPCSFLANPAGAPALAGISHQVISREWMPILAVGFNCLKRPTFFHHVIHVVLMRTQKEMTRIYTSAIVACVQYGKVSWLFVEKNRIGHSTGNQSSTAKAKQSIAEFRFDASPFPAGVCARCFYFFQKSFEWMAATSHKGVIVCC